MSDLLLLCYHAVSERWPAALSVTPEQLTAHVSWLLRRGYGGVTFGEAVAGAAPSKAVAITFDDAFRSVFELALPILSGAGLPATVFAPTDFIAREKPMSWPGVERWLQTEHSQELVPMNWSELASLAGQGWEVGSHTRSHPSLTDLPPDALDAELQGSRAEVERRLGQPCRSLAYPFGIHDQRVINAAQRAGYTAAAGTLPGRLRPPSGPLDWSRIVVNHVDGLGRFRAKVWRSTRRLKASPAWDLVAATRRRVRSVRPGSPP